MTQKYRTDDGTKWGSGIGRNLTPTEVDVNFWEAIQRIVTLEARPTPSAGIDHFSISGQNLYVTLTDTTVLGPYALPVATFRYRGVWASATSYQVLDTFTINGGLYEVIFAHTSAGSFSAGANDGAGHDYYALMIQTPGSALPSGGAAGQLLKKASSTDYAVTWANEDASQVTYTPGTGVVSSAHTVADALDDLSVGSNAAHISYDPPSGSALSTAGVSTVAGALDALDQSTTIGKQTLWIPATAMIPQITNGPSLGIIETSTAKVMLKTLDFDPSVSEVAQFDFAIPKSWDQTKNVSFRAYWSHGSGGTAFGVQWYVTLYYKGHDYALDAIDTLATIGVSQTSSGVADTMYITDESTLAAPGSSALAGDMYIVTIYRSPTASGDTLDIDARLHGLQFFYHTKAGADD